MPKLQTFYIEYQNDGQIYFPGQPVNGRLVIVLKEPMKMRQVRLVICGKAHIHWTQPKDSWHKDVDGSSHFVSSTRIYKDTEMYMNNEVILWDKQSSTAGEQPTMPAGTNYFNFAFILPTTCPSSFESERGYIRYYCKAVIDRQWKSHLTTQRAISVVSLVDLNNMPAVESPRREEKSRTLHAFLWVKKMGKFNFEVNIPRWGFVPGELIPFEVKLDNDSSTEITYVSASLVEMALLVAHNRHTHCCEREVARLQKNNIPAKQTFIWKNDTLKVPPLAPSTTTRVLQIMYTLRVKVNPKGMHCSETISIPLFIGNMPLRSTIPELNQNFRDLVSHEAATSAIKFDNSQAASAPMMPLQFTMYPDLPPPTYEEAVFEQTNISDENGESGVNIGSTSFAPKYTYYNWNQRH